MELKLGTSCFYQGEAAGLKVLNTFCCALIASRCFSMAGRLVMGPANMISSIDEEWIRIRLELVGPKARERDTALPDVVAARFKPMNSLDELRAADRAFVQAQIEVGFMNRTQLAEVGTFPLHE